MQRAPVYQEIPPTDQNGDFVGQQGGQTYRCASSVSIPSLCELTKCRLRVDQQPIRARMCGFGDKDRRPITPPPCIRLIMCDAATGQEVDANEIDTTFYTLVVDLWHEDISRGACNLVRHSSAAPTVSIIVAQPSTSSNHTRNLIGQISVNAFKLNDPDGKPGFWFVLQDLSVRTEGTFRLKFMIFNIGSGENMNSIIGHGDKTPMLASCFSDPFTVYSAKKFPGVIESTTLSKCFAQQGIKIPIRKDGPRTLANQAEFDADD
ncbi:hypothetical protein EJ07DRAFT_116244 [Lizonia empirigonia]|nr:hypothetical protein EJ07DRAFT_116244 [Lizonia empirigonia]